MIALNSGDELRGDASVAAQIDYTIYGEKNGVPTLLADGQLPSSEGILYQATGDIKIGSIIFVNTDSTARTLNLKVSQNQGTARLIMPKDVSLEPSYSLIYNEGDLTVLTATGKVYATGASEVLDDTSPQLGGDLDMNSHNVGGNTEAELDNAVLLKHTQNTDTAAGGEWSFGAHSAGFTLQTATGVVGTTDIDWKLGNLFEFTFGAGNETLTFTAPTKPGEFNLIVIQDGTGSRLMTWPVIKWVGGAAPTLTTAAGGIDKITLVYNGTSYYGKADLAFAPVS